MKIVHSAISENGNAGWDGKAKAGDQTGGEVCVRDWYKKPWNIMLRYRDKEIARRVSEIAVKLANSNLVGYDQSQRNTLYQALKKYNWDVDKYIESGEKTECDCSSFIYACWCCVLPLMRGEKNAPVTAEMRDFYKASGFTCYKADKYISGTDYLRAGDILVKEGSHTAMAIDDSTIKITVVTASTHAMKFDRSIAGEYAVTEDLFIRDGASKIFKELGVLPKGTTVRCYGYFSFEGSKKWYYVQVLYNSCLYTGFCSSSYLLRI